MPRPRNAVNRTLLTVAGAGLTGAGLWALTGNAAVRERLPRGWPAAGPDLVLADRGALARAREHGWWTPTVIAVLAVAVLALAWWLLAQVRTRQPGVVALPVPGLGVRAGALARAMTEQTERLPGVARARVRLSGRPRRLLATVDVHPEPDADPARLLASLAAGVVADARSSGAPLRLDARVRIHGAARRGTGYRISSLGRAGRGPERAPLE
ncbi:hypothetical protein AB0O07_35210 [Streptomyces sp. NPDC093085]|uniref:hypothetical protein n=1 Tax=Streptomyces sp. NPDC093085 TaxID=3155068 RepID=UPI0034389044